MSSLYTARGVIRYRGEDHGPLTHTVRDLQGGPVDVTGWTVEYVYARPDGTTGTLPAGIADGPNGVVTVEQTSDLTSQVGNWRGQWWATNGGTVLDASPVHRWHVLRPIGGTSPFASTDTLVATGPAVMTMTANDGTLVAGPSALIATGPAVMTMTSADAVLAPTGTSTLIATGPAVMTMQVGDGTITGGGVLLVAEGPAPMTMSTGDAVLTPGPNTLTATGPAVMTMTANDGTLATGGGAGVFDTSTFDNAVFA